MDVNKLMELRLSNEAPYSHDEYTVWLHNKIIDSINYELWKFREEKSYKIKSTYAACNHIMSLESLQKINLNNL